MKQQLYLITTETEIPPIFFFAGTDSIFILNLTGCGSFRMITPNIGFVIRLTPAQLSVTTAAPSSMAFSNRALDVMVNLTQSFCSSVKILHNKEAFLYNGILFFLF